MVEEYLDVLTDTGAKTGQTKSRKLVHQDGDWHQTVHIWIINSRGDILLQRRALEKESHPGQLDISCAGHISAGDSALDSALRELHEELGLELAESDLEHIGAVKSARTDEPKYLNNEFTEIYLVRRDFDPAILKLQPEEVSECFFLPYREFKAMVTRRDPDLVAHPDEEALLFQKLDPEFDNRKQG